MLHRLRSFARDHTLVRAAALRAMAYWRRFADAPPGLYTLCYHHVRTEHRRGFAAQLAHLASHGRFVGADEAVALVASGRATEERHVLVTFDDGYADTVTCALPVLRDAGVPATLFLVSDWIEAPPDDPPGPYLGPAEIEAWLAAGMGIGSHSAGHARLSRLDAGGVRRELDSSRAALERLTGTPVRHFACPWGVAGADYDPERDPALAAACGYESFFTTRRGRATAPGDLLAMPRHVVEPEWLIHELDALIGASRGARA